MTLLTGRTTLPEPRHAGQDQTPAPAASALPPVPVWLAAVRSFLPARLRGGAHRWLVHSPLALVLVVQALAATRLSNSVFQDEALYIYEGHVILDRWLGRTDLDRFADAYFSGAPQLYPVFAAVLDGVGGLGLVRVFSLLCMLAATVAVHRIAQVLFDDAGRSRAGLLAATVFALSSSVLFLGSHATFDAVSFSLIAWAFALAVGATTRPTPLRRSVLVGVLLALAVMLKYASAVDLPFVVLTALAAAPRGLRLRALAHGALITAVTSAILLGSVATWAEPLLAGLRMTTTGRQPFVGEPTAVLLGWVTTWAGIPLALALVGAAVVGRRRPILAFVLLLGSGAALGSQILAGESVSLHKHVVLGLVFAAPLAGAVLARCLRRRIVPLALVAVVLWGAGSTGVVQAEEMNGRWPDSTALAQELTYSVDAMPWIRMMGDTPEPVQYALRARTEPWQWTSTYEDAFFYKGLGGVPAYERALAENYFQLVFFDSSSRIGRELEPQMADLGFRLTSEVRQPESPGSSWRIYQRTDGIGTHGDVRLIGDPR